MDLFRPLDTLIIIFILLGTGLAVYAFQGSPGNQADIFLGSKRIARFDLNSEERIRQIDTRIGTIRIRVGNGSIQVLSSPCNQKICMLQGAIQHTHEHIICLPAQMYISVVNTENPDHLFERIDAISY